MANNIFDIVAKRLSYTLNRRRNKKQRKLRLFLPVGLVGFVVIDILGPLPKAEGGHRYITVKTNRYSKLTKPISIAKRSATVIRNIFLEYCVANS